MQQAEIQTLMEGKHFPDNLAGNASFPTQLKETHISYVILTEKHAYKIKKPIKTSFLDFSTLELRQYYCQRELELNRRLAASMYQEVLPVRKKGAEFYIGQQEGEIVDYALKMQRMDNRREMDELLKKEEVTEAHIEKIAQKIARFHQEVEIIRQPFNLEDYKERFNAINEQREFIEKNMNAPYVRYLDEAVAYSDDFLEKNVELLQARHQQGMIRDGHGDLHSKNIFLYDDPVIFDCIEFSDHYRYLDVLNEIAFFCMDLEAYQAHSLSELFYQKYTELMPENSFSAQDRFNLFNYYKCFRANVRAKVTAMAAHDITDEKKLAAKIKEVKVYLELMRGYYS